jgi:carboxyl-terminal processing protease
MTDNECVMTSRTRWLILLISTPLVFLVGVGGLLGAQASGRQQRSFAELQTFSEVLQYVLAAYVEEVDSDRIMDGAMRGLADSLDASSAFLTAPEVRAVVANEAPPAGDVGLIVSRQFGYLRVLGVREGSPAARARLRPGDFIRVIDDTPARDLSAFAGMRRLRGAPGSKVTLVVFRSSAADPHTVPLVREVIKEERVTARRLPGGEGYVRVASFTTETAADLRKQIASLDKAAAAGLVIDLRGTADGTPADGAQAARLFLKAGTTVATRATRGDERTVTKAEAGDGTLTMPVVVLVSSGTAHAAEVFAAALDDNGRADLVGEPTAGLAGEQRLVRLPQGYGLWMTYAKYLRSDGKALHGEGLEPDVVTDPVVVEFGDLPPAGDAALDKAVERLKTKR